MKICLSFATGGHLDQIMSLFDVFEDHDIIFITTQTIITKDLENISKVYYIPHGPKLTSTPLDYLILGFYYAYLFIPSIKIMFKEKPDLIIGCGGEATVDLFYLAKIMGKHVMYLESLARINNISKTGMLVYHISDLFLVQWKSLCKNYSKSRFWGRVI